MIRSLRLVTKTTLVVDFFRGVLIIICPASLRQRGRATVMEFAMRIFHASVSSSSRALVNFISTASLKRPMAFSPRRREQERLPPRFRHCQRPRRKTIDSHLWRGSSPAPGERLALEIHIPSRTATI